METSLLQDTAAPVQPGLVRAFGAAEQGAPALLPPLPLQRESAANDPTATARGELEAALAAVRAATLAELTTHWSKLGERLAAILLAMPAPGAPQALADAAQLVVALTERAPELAIFMLVAQPAQADKTPYGVVRSLHAAAAAHIVATRLGWPAQRCLTLIKAALTMNLSILELQERLSNQARLPSPAQRNAIHLHPHASAATLRASGVDDADWLSAVEQHHEKPGGGGFPSALVEVCELASALRAVDVYTAKLAGRSGRDALPPERAARDLLVVERGNAFALALVTEFGLHPPGSLVRLHNGEVGYVIERAADTGAPRVAVVTGRRGEPLQQPVARAAAGRELGIAGPAEPRVLRVRVSAERLYAHAQVQP